MNISLCQGIFISKISENGPAGKDGILQTGDKILKVCKAGSRERSRSLILDLNDSMNEGFSYK